MGEPATTTSTITCRLISVESQKIKLSSSDYNSVLVLIAVWIAAFLIPSGQYQVDASGSPIAGSFKTIHRRLTLVIAFGIASGSHQRIVRDQESCDPAESARLITEPVQFCAGVSFHSRDRRLHDRGVLYWGTRPWHSPSCLSFSCARAATHRGAQRAVRHPRSVMAWSDDTLGLYALMVPLMIALGYDRMVAVAVVSVAPFLGSLGLDHQPVRHRHWRLEEPAVHRLLMALACACSCCCSCWRQLLPTRCGTPNG